MVMQAVWVLYEGEGSSCWFVLPYREVGVGRMNLSTPFYVPSYVGQIDGEKDFEKLADSIMHIGDLRFKQIIGRRHSLQVDDIDYVLRCDKETIITVPSDDQLPVPIGSQVAILNYSNQRVAIERDGDVVIAGTDRRIVTRWRVGVLVKYDANFWLLSLGSGSGSGGTTTPTAPVLKTATPTVLGISIAWDKPVDDGGATVTSYTAETSTDNGAHWGNGAVFTGVQTSGEIPDLTPGTQYSVRLRAENSVGLSEPSNILTAIPKPKLPPQAPQLSYVAEGQFSITNFDDKLSYTVSGATRSGSLLTGVSNNATIAASFEPDSIKSNVSTMNVLANARILSPGDNQSSTGCGPRGDLCCPGGQIMDAGGRTCGGAPGSFIADPSQAAAFCNGQCNDNCWSLTIACYNWRWTDYTADGYKLIGQIWGRAVNG